MCQPWQAIATELWRVVLQEKTISLYRCGPMVDLCTGPHLPNTGYLKAAAVSAMSRANWRGDVTREPLQVRCCAGLVLGVGWRSAPCRAPGGAVTSRASRCRCGAAQELGAVWQQFSGC